MRIAITGSPQSGKSSAGKLLSAVLDIPLFSTDSLLIEDLEWSETSRRVAEWLDRQGDWIIEGVVVPRAIRKWAAFHPTMSPPFDRFIFLPEPRTNLIKLGQQIMAKQVIALSEEYREWIGSRWVQLDASFDVLSSAKKSAPPTVSNE